MSSHIRPTSPPIDVVYDIADRSTATTYSQELKMRQIQVRLIEGRSTAETSHHEMHAPANRVVVLSERALLNKGIQNLLASPAQNDRPRSVLLPIEPLEVPPHIRGLPTVAAYQMPFDLAFEALFRFLLGPLPPWLDVICRPSQIRRPTGAAWWSEDMILADEYYGHLIKLRNEDTSVILAGLDEPYHVHIDRQYIALANTGANEIITGRLRGGALADLASVISAAGIPFNRPHCAFTGNGYTVVADTDNHRVVYCGGRATSDTSDWCAMNGLTVSFPCSVYGSNESVWIADTFSHRLVNADLKGLNPPKCIIGKAGTGDEDFSFPVALCAWNDLLFVSDEQNCRLKVYRIGQTSPVLVTAGMAADFIGSPMGVSVNRFLQALVADRNRRCYWVIDLRAAGLYGD